MAVSEVGGSLLKFPLGKSGQAKSWRYMEYSFGVISRFDCTWKILVTLVLPTCSPAKFLEPQLDTSDLPLKSLDLSQFSPIF